MRPMMIRDESSKGKLHTFASEVEDNIPSSRALPYKVSNKHSRISSAVSGLKERNEAEDNEIVAILERVRQGTIQFWNSNTPSL